MTIQEAARQLRSNELSSRELTEACLANADERDDLVGAYMTRFDDAARAAATVADREIRAGLDRGPLHGIPIGIKDIIAAAGGPTTAQSLAFDPGWWDGQDAPVVSRLRAAGAVITGKTTAAEFALGIPDFDKPFPVPRNPWDLGRWPGGSSSGSASGVASGFFLGGLGSDTGGSIRIPAALCGVSGLLPTYGRVSTAGCVPLSSSLDRVGPLARSAWDCAALLEALTGETGFVPGSDLHAGMLSDVRIGVLRADQFYDSDPALEPAFAEAMKQLEALGASTVDVVIPAYGEVTAAAGVTLVAEALSYHRHRLQSRWSDYFERTRERLLRGVLVTGADYVQAQRVRHLGQRYLADLFERVDVIASPTLSIGAPTYEYLNAHGIGGVTASINTAYWNAVGNPAIAIPMGVTEAGLPLSLQLASSPWDEAALLTVSWAFQAETDWHLRAPMESAGVDQLASEATPTPLASTPPDADVDLVGALLAVSGLTPSVRERDALATSYPGFRRSIESLYALENADAEPMAMTFVATASDTD